MYYRFACTVSFCFAMMLLFGCHQSGNIEPSETDKDTSSAPGPDSFSSPSDTLSGDTASEGTGTDDTGSASDEPGGSDGTASGNDSEDSDSLVDSETGDVSTDELAKIQISDVTIWSNCQEFSGPYPLLSSWNVSFSNVIGDTAVLMDASLILEKNGMEIEQMLQTNIAPVVILQGEGAATQRIETVGKAAFFDDICVTYCQDTMYTLTLIYYIGETEMATAAVGAFRCSG